MSDFKQKPGFGSLFRNKKENDKQPDYRGDICTPNGEQLQVAGWIKQDKNGKGYMSLKVQEPRASENRDERKPAPTPRPQEDFEDAPF